MEKITIENINKLVTEFDYKYRIRDDIKELKIKKLFQILNINKKELKTISSIYCGKEIYGLFAYYFSPEINVRYIELLGDYECIFSESDNLKVEVLNANEVFKDILVSDGIGQDYKFSLMKPFTFTRGKIYED